MSNYDNDFIDIVHIIKKLIKEKKIVFFISITFVLTGIIISLLQPIIYTSSTTFIPQTQEISNSNLSGVANLIGLNLGISNSGKEISSTMYPKISESPEFKRLLLSEVIDKKSDLTLKKYLIDYYDIVDEKAEKSTDIKISFVEQKCFEIIGAILEIEVSEADGFVTISASMNDAEYSAQVANLSKNILQRIIIDNKIESANQNLIYAEKQLEEKKLIFDEIHARLAYFTDSNLNSINSFLINEKNKLQAEFDIINSVVAELSTQVEQARLQVKKDTPVFSTINKAYIPNYRSSPNRKRIVIIFSFIGFTLSVFFVLIKDYILELSKKIRDWKE